MKKTSKVVLIVTLVLLLSISLMACNGNNGNGKSAYEIAVDNGFIGSEQEWLNSLVGQPGKNGSNGLNGANGVDGKDAQTLSPENLYELYETAVNKDGFTGNFVEFLASLGIDAKGVISSQDNKAAINKALLSVVSILAYRTSNQEAGGSAGSGVIYKLDKEQGNATIITNYHVVYTNTPDTGVSQNIFINLYGEELPQARIPAKFIGGSEYYDLAVIQVTGSERLKQSYARAVDVETQPTVVGETALAIGNPKNRGIAVTEGIVSKKSEKIPLRTVSGKTIKGMEVMRIDALVNSGNSGGGLFNSKGNLIGIVNAKSVEKDVDGVNYSIPLEVVIAVANNIIETCNGSETRVFMAKVGVNIQLIDSVLQEVKVDGKSYYATKETLQVTTVYPESLAAKLGVEKDDILVSMTYNGKEHMIDDFDALTPMLLDVRVGYNIELKVLRGDKEVSLKATIEPSDMVIADIEKFQNQ